MHVPNWALIKKIFFYGFMGIISLSAIAVTYSLQTSNVDPEESSASGICVPGKFCTKTSTICGPGICTLQKGSNNGTCTCNPQVKTPTKVTKEPAKVAETKPNFVLILMDDLDENLLNQMLALDLLPNIKNQIVNMSKRYINSFTTDSSCCPSRASVLTGKYPHNHNVKSVFDKNNILTDRRNLKGAWNGFQYVEDQTIAQYLKRDAGYTNGFVGKFFHGYGDGKKYPLRGDEQIKIFGAGWDMFKPMVVPEYHLGPNEYTTIQLDKGQGNGGPWTIKPNRTEAEYLGIQSEYFINKNAGKSPFFLEIAPIEPHVTDSKNYPITNAHEAWIIRTIAKQCYGNNIGFQAKDFIDPNTPVKSPVSGICPQDSLRTAPSSPKDLAYLPLSLKSNAFANFESGAPWNTGWVDIGGKDNNSFQTDPNYMGLLRLHLDRMESMRSIDVLVGKVIASLKSKGVMENTVVIFTSDNGYLMGEHNLNNKIVPYEESIKTPFFLRFDKLVKRPGSTSTKIALNIDIAPTIADMARLKWDDPKYGFDGRPINTALDNTPWRESFIVENWKFTSNYWEYPDFKAYRNSQGKKFVEYYNNIESDTTPIYGQYFDTKNDKNEITNKYFDSGFVGSAEYNNLKCLTNKLATCKGESCRVWDQATKCN